MPFTRKLSSLCRAGILILLAMLGFACSESYSYSSRSENLADGRVGGTSVAFGLNHRSVKLELYLRIDGGSALIELDHPDGRTTEALEIKGPGIHAFSKEYAKEPGSWGLSVSARGGSLCYWAALHDGSKYLGPDPAARSLVDRY